MDDSIRVMVERGKKKRVVALRVRLARLGQEREDRGGRAPGARRLPTALREGGGAGRPRRRVRRDRRAGRRRAARGQRHDRLLRGLRQGGRPEQEQMSEAECERKIALLRASWTYFDDVASRVSAELRRVRAAEGAIGTTIVRHVNGAEIQENGRKVGVRSSHDAWQGPRRSPRPPRGDLRGDPRVQRPRPIGRELVDGPVLHPALRLAHARPRVGDGGPGPVQRLLTRRRGYDLERRPVRTSSE